jgi:polysaccharide biosynthesis transport protein
MNFLQFLLILKARYRIVLITFFLIVIGTFVVSELLPKTYSATTSLVLNYKGVDPVTGLTLPAQMMPGYMPTQVDIIKSQTVALKVVEDLKLTESEQVQAQFNKATGGEGSIKVWLADRLIGNLEARPSRESSVMQITFQGSDPNFAAIIANKFAENYKKVVLQLKMDPAHTASTYFEEQIAKSRKQLQEAQAKLSSYQQEHGITSVIEQADIESSRLNELSAQLSAAQSQAIESESRQQSAHNNTADSPDVAATPIVQSLKTDAARAESKLAELSQHLAKNHPQYIAAQAELDKIRSQLQEEIRRASGVVGGSAKINKQREADLRYQVELQKKKLLEFNRTRDEMSVLQKDVENAQRSLDAMNQRYSQTTIESQANQADIAVLSVATPPPFASSPRVFLNVLLSAFVGALLAIGAGVMTEMLDRRVRSADDIADVLEVPVFSMRSGEPKSNPFKQFLQQLRGKFKPRKRFA